MIRSSLSATAKATLRGTNASAASNTNTARAASNRGTKLTSTCRHRQSRSKSSLASVRPRSRSPSTSLLSVKDSNHHSRSRRTLTQHQLVASSCHASNSAAAAAAAFHNNNNNNSTNCHTSKGYLQRSSEEEEERLVVMRLFLDSLQLATANTTLSNNATTSTNILGLSETAFEHRTYRDEQKSPTTSLIRESENANEVDREATATGTGTMTATESSKIIHNANEESQSQSATPTATAPTTTTRSNKSKSADEELKKNSSTDGEFARLRSALRRSVYHKDPQKSMFLFRESQRNLQILPRAAITDLFFMVSETDPVSAYAVIQYYNDQYLHQEQKGGTTSKSGGGIVDLDSYTHKRRSLYKRIANSVSLLDPQHHNTRQMHILIDSLLHEIDEMDAASKRAIYPQLIVSLVSQRIATIGQYAHGLYESLIDDEGFETKVGWLNRLLSMSRYNRPNDVPYHDVMERLVKIPGGQLNPESVLPAIQNMFPFTNTEAVCVALTAWLEDFRNKFGDLHNGDDDASVSSDDNRVRAEPLLPKPEDLIDLSTLETISTGASQAGSSELVLLVWDVLEVCHYHPTETIYENTVMAFANEKGGLKQAFAAMASMKDDGFEPSRPLLRSFSSAIRLRRFLIGRARRMLIDDRQNEMANLETLRLLSLESLNVILSSYAERGDPKDTVEILHLMTENDIEPNADSYSFVIEALGRDIKKRLKTKDHEYMQRNIGVANTILSMMEDKQTAPTTHVIRNYVELLCLAGETETATSIVEDYLSNSDPSVRNTINNITIYRVASENASLGNFERAKALAAQMTESVPALHRRIRSKEQRSLYLEETVLE